MEDEQPVSTPLDPHAKLDGITESAVETALEDKGIKFYQAILDSLMYAALATRPDIVSAVAALCRYNTNLQIGHMRLLDEYYASSRQRQFTDHIIAKASMDP